MTSAIDPKPAFIISHSKNGFLSLCFGNEPQRRVRMQYFAYRFNQIFPKWPQFGKQFCSMDNVIQKVNLWRRQYTLWTEKTHRNVFVIS